MSEGFDGAIDPGRRRGRTGGRAGLLGVGLILLAGGCLTSGRGDPVALRVGPRTVGLLDLRSAFFEALKSDTTLHADTTSLRKFLPSYEDQVLMEVLGQEAVPVLEGVPKSNFDEFRAQLLVKALREQAYGKASVASEKELQAAYAMLGRKLKLAYILVSQESDASQILKALREGAAFAKVAEQKSEDPRSRTRGGDIGWITYYDLDAGTRDQVFSLKVGDLAGPFAWNSKYQVFKVEEEGVNDKRRPFEQERQMLQSGVTFVRSRDAAARYREDLYRKYHFKMDPTQVAWLTVLLHDKTAGFKRGLTEADMADPQAAIAEQESKRPFTSSPIAPADTGRVIATFDPPEGLVKPMLVLDQLLTDPSLAWPTFDTSKDVESLVRNLVIERLEMREAEARKIPQIPDIARQLAQIDRDVHRRLFYRTHVRARAHPTAEQSQAYYEAHKSEYQEPERRRFIGISCATWDVALHAARLLRAGQSLTDAQAACVKEDPTIHGTGEKGTEPLAYGQSPMLDRFVFTLPMGGVSDPIPVQNRFTVAKVVEITPAHLKTFSEVKNSIDAAIGGARADSISGVMLAEARQKYPITLHWEVARRAVEIDPKK